MYDAASLANDPSVYLRSLMQAGQPSTKQFDDALALAMGVGDPAKWSMLRFSF